MAATMNDEESEMSLWEIGLGYGAKYRAKAIWMVSV